MMGKMGCTACIVALGLIAGFSVRAQQPLPEDTEAAQLQDAITQSSGEYDEMNLGYIQSLGMQQKAWNNPMAHMGEGQTKPGYSRYAWTPDVVLPIRIREGMMTLINLPTWELVEKVHIGSPESFGGEIAAPNSLLVYADPSYIGVDSNMIIFGRSGNRYIFYLRSEVYNTDKITQNVVDVLVPPKYTPAEDGGQLADLNGASVRMDTAPAVSGNAPGWAGGGRQNPTIGLNTASTGPQNWMQSIPVDPESFRFDIDMYIPNPADIDIAPDSVWRDNIFTYIDLGPKALTMVQRPIVNLLVQDSEVPVGFRTRGPNSRLIVVEGIGDMVLRNGKKIICLKLRRDPAMGLEHTDYSGAQKLPPKTPYRAVAQGSAYQAMQPVGVPVIPRVMTDCPKAVGNCSEAVAGINDVMMGLTTGGKTTAPNLTEVVSVELGALASIAELESLWSKAYAKNQDVLKGYEPFYSLDTTADGDVKDLFRLRIGPMTDVQTADAVCTKLGRRGFTCSVIRVQ